MTRKRSAGRLTLAATIAAAAVALVSGTAGAQVLPPTYGSRTLSVGEDNAVSIDLQAGGPIAAAQILGPPCVGMVANAPDFGVMLQGRGQAELVVSVTSSADTTLVLGLPNGQWLCNDDHDGVNPAISVPAAVAGAYNIWVGTYDATGLPQARLEVRTRTGATPPVVTGPGALETEDAGEFWYAADGSSVGPVPLSEIEAAIDGGTITPETLVWQDGMENWEPADSVPAIEALFQSEPPPLPEPVGPPPLPPVEESGPPALPDEGKADGVEDGEVEGGLMAEADQPAMADAPSREALLDACRNAADAFNLDAAEIDPTCDCTVDRLSGAELGLDQLAAFAADFEAAAQDLQSTDELLYDEIDAACF